MTRLHRVKNLVMVIFGLVTREFTKVMGVHALIDQQFGYVRLAAPLQDRAGSVLSFVGRSVLSFVSHYSLGGVTAMPRGLHARLCHAFLVCL